MNTGATEMGRAAVVNATLLTLPECRVTPEKINITDSYAGLAQRIGADEDEASIRLLSCLRLLRMVRLRSDEDPAAEVARVLRIRKSVVREWLQAYSEHGLEGLLSCVQESAIAGPSGPQAEDPLGRGPAETARPAPPAAPASEQSPDSCEAEPPAESAGTSPGPVAAPIESVPAADGPDPHEKIVAASSERINTAPERPPIRRAPEPETQGAALLVADPARAVSKSHRVAVDVAGGVDTSAAVSVPRNRGGSDAAADDFAPSAGRFPGVRILVADVDEMIRTVIRHRLEREGAEVVDVADGMKAIGLLQAETFDLAVMSVALPGLDGFEVIGWLREQTDAAYVPVVMLEWPGDPSVMLRSFELGADDFLRKPFSPVELLARLQRLLARRPAGKSADVL